MKNMRNLKNAPALSALVSLLCAYSSLAFYNPSTGRWLSRDPIEERGGLNLQGAFVNNPISRVDPLGLDFYQFNVLPGEFAGAPMYYGDSLSEDIAAFFYNVGAAVQNIYRFLDPPPQEDVNYGTVPSYVGGPAGVGNVRCLRVRWAPGIQRYREGNMTAAEHVFSRHGPSSGYPNVSKFAPGTSLRDVSRMVNEAVANGTRTGNSVVYDFGRAIGTNPTGLPATRLQVYLNSAGEVRTAFPF